MSLLIAAHPIFYCLFLQSDQFEDSKEDTWVCFCQSDSQKKLLNDIEIEKYRVSVDGPFKVYIESNIVTYFVLYARDLSPKPNFVPLEEDLNKAHELNSNNRKT